MSKIDYDLSIIRGIAFDIDGVLSPSTVPIDQDGKPCRMGNVKDGYAIQFAVKAGLKIAVISGGSSERMANRMKLLGVDDVWQGASDKLPRLNEWMEKHGLKKEEVGYMGDDIPDLRCLRNVGLPCCPYDAAWEVKTESVYVSSYSGGYGAVRDVLEQILRAKGMWKPESMNNLLW